MTSCPAKNATLITTCTKVDELSCITKSLKGCHFHCSSLTYVSSLKVRMLNIFYVYLKLEKTKY